MKSSKYVTWILDNWRPLAAGFALILIICTVLIYRLGSLTSGGSQQEIAYLTSIRSGKNLLLNPLFLIHKLPVYILFKLGNHSLALYRLISVLFTGITILVGFIMLKIMYSTRVATLGATLLLTSAWMLHVGRLAAPESSFLLLLPLIFVATWLHSTTRHYYALPILSSVIIISFYIPGFWLLTATVIIWERRAILRALQAVPWWFRIACGVLTTLGLLPLIWAAAHTPSILLSISGLPNHTPTLKLLGKNFARIPENLLLRGPSDPARWLGRLPILDVFSIAMLIFGVYSFRYHLRQTVIQMLAGSIIVMSLLIALGGPTTITALVPLLYIFIGGGVAFMLQQWLTVFPRNPIARTTATTMMSVTVLLVAYFHINHYFVAWPQTPSTKHVFGNSLVK